MVGREGPLQNRKKKGPNQNESRGSLSTRGPRPRRLGGDLNPRWIEGKDFVSYVGQTMNWITNPSAEEEKLPKKLTKFRERGGNKQDVVKKQAGLGVRGNTISSGGVWGGKQAGKSN